MGNSDYNIFRAMSNYRGRPWGVHAIEDIYTCGVDAGLPDGRWVAGVAEPYTANRLQAAWWVLTGKAFALIWPKPGDLEDALRPPLVITRRKLDKIKKELER